MSFLNKKILDQLDQVKIKSWFDIGLFLDQLKQGTPVRTVKDASSEEELKDRLRKGVAFATYVVGIDGVSIEMYKYSSAIKTLLGKETPIHWIVGEVDSKIGYFKNRPDTILHILPEMKGFKEWGDPYKLLFFTKLKRGSQEYNDLPITIWEETKILTKKLLDYIEQNNIELFLTTNIESNPGNLSLTLSLIIISELYNIYVIGSNHDYYWEGGAKRQPNEKKGLRDHFFKNADMGEIFSIIQTIYPWDSPRWLHANINTLQSETLIHKIGINPFHVSGLTTSIDTNTFRRLSANEKQKTWQKLSALLYGFAQTSRPEKLTSGLAKNLPLLISLNQRETYDLKNTWVFLQPTRIIERKNIERNFEIIENLLKKTPLKTAKQKILLIITGPVASDSDGYYQYLLIKIKKLYSRLGQNGKRVSIGFLFGKMYDKKLHPLRINELYGISDLVFLLSDLEGRGLPIVESAAARVPLVVNRFYPEEVYKEVLGLDGPPKHRMRVLELPPEISNQFINEIYLTLTDRIFNKKLVDHNHNIVRLRYSMPALTKNFSNLIEKLWLLERNHRVHISRARRVLAYALKVNKKDDCDVLIYDRNRTYIPGISQLRFLSQVKSIVDPTYFRIEEQEIRSRLFDYAVNIMPENISENRKELFFGAIDQIFAVTKGKYQTQLDHSFDYRHRTQKISPWRGLTELGMKGAIKKLAEIVFDNISEVRVRTAFLNNINKIAIDSINNFCIKNDKKVLVSDFYDNILKNKSDLNNFKNDKGHYPENLPIIPDDWNIFTKRIIERPQMLAIFPGAIGDVIFELLVYDKILANWNKSSSSYHITFLTTKKRFGYEATVSDLHEIISQNENIYPNICEAYRHKRISVVDSGSRCSGVNLKQLSPEARRALLLIKENDGHILAKGEDLYYGLDLVDINSFRFGIIRRPYSEAIFGAKAGSGFFQFIPAGLRPFFGFPLTVETPAKFSQSLQKIDINDNSALKKVKEFLDEHATSFHDMVETANAGKNEKEMSRKRLSGKYSDGYAWTGVAVRINKRQKSFNFHIATSKINKTLPQIVKLFEKRVDRKIILGWNGGYILTSELVGKLGLSEESIGTPLGLVISRGRVMSLPLFNRPAFGVTKRGKVIIEKVCFNFSGKLSFKNGQTIVWDKHNINNSKSKSGISVYTPMSGFETISRKNCSLVVISGKKVIKTSFVNDQSNIDEPLFPAGITFAIPADYPLDVSKIKIGDEVLFDIDFPAPWNRVTEAMEAGPLLVKHGRTKLNLAEEGWILKHSIATQGARRDRDNERGPKIGCGVTRKGDIICVAIESRIRESVGATYEELAKILIKEGTTIAMGFDPGGSASLWFENNIVNIVPYSKTYNTHPISGKPEPRPIESAVLISLDKE